MTLANFLETFDGRESVSASAKGATETIDVEKEKSQSFDLGYASGWEDAQKSLTEAQQRIEAEFERNIQNLVFTYSEAVDCVRGELKTFIAAIIEGFLPEMVPDLTREHVRNELLKIADDLVEAPVEIVTAPDSKALLENLLEGEFALSIGLVEDATLAPRQVYIRIAEREIEVNVAPMVEALRMQLQAISVSDEDRTING